MALPLAAALAFAVWGLLKRAPRPAPEPSPAPAPAAPAALDARLTRAEGGVFLRLAGSDETRFIRAKAGTPLSPQDIIRTGPDGRAEIALEGESLIELGPRSYMIVEDLAAAKPAVYFRLGSLVARLKLRQGAGFDVRTPNAVCSVRGTELALARLPDEPLTRVAILRRGKVVVRAADRPEVLELGPGQETSVGLEGVARAPEVLDALKPLEKRAVALEARAPEVGEAWLSVSADDLAAERGRAATAEAVKAEEMEREPKKAPFDPLQEVRERLRKEVGRKMKRDKSLAPIRDELRKLVEDKAKKDKRKKR